MSDRNNWATPPEFFDKVQNLVAKHSYRITLDVCASADNAKTHIYYNDLQDGLHQKWTTAIGCNINYRGVAWCNPPYGRGLTEPWVNKAIAEYEWCNHRSILLLPSRTDTDWFHKLLHHYSAHICFLPKRIRFIPPPGIKASSPTEASILVFMGIDVKQSEVYDLLA
jgi:phage N-6-adenine-methyltransferase